MKKKNQQTEQPSQAKPAKALKRKRIEVAAHQLRSAPWNPRPEITSESVADITASIREIGLIQPLVVMKDPVKQPFGGVDFYMVVAGHRRFRACVDAGLNPIPCDLIDCDEATARRITMIENLQRKDADPLMEADLIAGLIASGMTQTEIAAETGRGERWVARRANLVKLSPSWRKRVASGEQITIDCLEHIAAYPEAIQEKLKDTSGSCYYGSERLVLSWPQVKYVFQRESRTLSDVPFNTDACKTCANNTACAPDLFDVEDARAKLGKCLCAKCYAEKMEAAISAAIEKAEKRGRVVVQGKAPYKCGVYARPTKKPTGENTALYVYTESGAYFRTIVYAPPPPPVDEDAKRREKEEKQAWKEAQKNKKLIDTARGEAADKFEQWIEDQGPSAVWPKWFIDAAIADLCEAIRQCGKDCEAAVDAFARNTSFTASDADAAAAYKELLAKGGVK